MTNLIFMTHFKNFLSFVLFTIFKKDITLYTYKKSIKIELLFKIIVMITSNRVATLSVKKTVLSDQKLPLVTLHGPESS